MPKKPSFYDKAGRGIANIIFSPTEILDSSYEILQKEGPTVAATKGLIQGFSRMVMDIFVGVFEVATSPFPAEIMKSPAYDSQVIEEYPPSDLYDNWY